MLSRTDSPSYGYQLKRGATTLTEAWDTNPRSSQNHFMLGHAEEWFYRGLAGIDIDMSRPEPRQIVIRPAFLAGVPEAQAELHMVLGTVGSSWTRDGSDVRLAHQDSGRIPSHRHSSRGSNRDLHERREATISARPMETSFLVPALMNFASISDSGIGRKAQGFRPQFRIGSFEAKRKEGVRDAFPGETLFRN